MIDDPSHGQLGAQRGSGPAACHAPGDTLDQVLRPNRMVEERAGFGRTLPEVLRGHDTRVPEAA